METLICLGYKAPITVLYLIHSLGISMCLVAFILTAPFNEWSNRIDSLSQINKTWTSLHDNKKNTRKEHFKHVISSKTFTDGYKGLVCASSVLSRQRLTNTWVTYFLLCIHSTTSPARVCEGLHHAVQRGGLLTLGEFRDSQRFWLTFFTWASLIFSSATRIFSAFALAACSSCGWHNDMLTKTHLQSITPIV